MTIESTVKIKQISPKDSRQNWTSPHFGAIFSFFLGISAIVIGTILTAEVWLFKTEAFWHVSVQTFINGLFYSALPLMLLGAYCLDKIDENKKKDRNENQM